MKYHVGECVTQRVMPDCTCITQAILLCRCTCGHCSVMSTERESICCKEIEQLAQLLGSGNESNLESQCITRHVDFTDVCLCRAVLTVALYSHHHRCGTSDVPEDENGYSYVLLKLFSFDMSFINRRFRYLAYRQLVWWGWEYLGRHRCVVLPSCTVSKVCSEFPFDECTGHQDPPTTP